MYNGKIYIAADHAGYELKEVIVNYLRKILKVEVEDTGPMMFDPQDDYPDFIIPAAKKAVENKSRLIAICGSGVGACMAANKVKGMRAAPAFNEEIAEFSRLHNNSNGLCLAGKFLTKNEGMEIVKKWLETDEYLEGKYERRNEKLEKLENEQ